MSEEKAIREGILRRVPLVAKKYDISPEAIERLRKDLEPLMNILGGVAKQQLKSIVTYAGELMNLIRTNCHDCMIFKNSNYTASGVSATIKDKFDGQLYKVTIEPLYQKDGE